MLGASAGRKFNEYFNITREGNFEGNSIPNRLEGLLPEDLLQGVEWEYSHTEPERLLPKSRWMYWAVFLATSR